MREQGKSWALYVFSSANALKAYTMEELIGLGISWVWMGLEEKNSAYSKLKGTDTHALVKTFQANGIRVLGSSIIGLESQTPENIDAAIDYAIQHDTDFHQFMLYTPVPGTPLYEEHRRQGTILDDLDLADIHGQYKFNFSHPKISRDQSEIFLLRAFRRDYEVNGPSIMRIIRSLLQGWQSHKNHPDRRVRARYQQETRSLPTVYAGALRAMERYFGKSNPGVAEKARSLRKAINAEFGLKARLAGLFLGPVLYTSIRREEKRLDSGWTYQPSMFLERRNWDAPPVMGKPEKVGGGEPAVSFQTN
jgi:hypothetical protein